MSSGGGLRPMLRRKNSTSSAASNHSTGSRRASFENKIASFTRKLSFGAHSNKSSDNPHAAGSAAAQVPPQQHDGGGTPRESISFDDIHDEHIVRSSTQQQQQQQSSKRFSLISTSSHNHHGSEYHGSEGGAAPLRTDSFPFSVHAPSIAAASTTSGAAAHAAAANRPVPPIPTHAEGRPAPSPPLPPRPAAATKTASAPSHYVAGFSVPQNPFKRQIPRILSFFGGTAIAVIVLQRIHILLAIVVAACSAYVLWVQLERAGGDLLWEAEWRTIETKAQQSGDSGETALWINHCLRIVWPLLNSELFTPFVDLLEDSLMQEVQKIGIVHGCRVEDLDQGRTALEIKGFKILDDDPLAFTGEKSAAKASAAPTPAATQGSAQDTGEYINIEVSFSYRGAKRKGTGGTRTNTNDDTHLAREVNTDDGSMEARENIHMLLYMMVGLQKIAAVELPVWVSVLGIDGKLRLRLQILPNPPFVKTVAITFPSLPVLELSARPLGRKMLIDAMQLPLVSTFILHSVENVIKGFISPRSYTVDVPALLGSADGPQHTYALGVVVIVLHEASHIPAADANGSSDPFVQISFAKAGKPLHRTRVWRRTRDPIWSEWTPLLVSPDEVRDKEYIRLTVYDADRFSADDALGKVEISLDRLIKSYHKHAAEPDVSRMYECREEPLQPMTRGGRTSGTLKYSAAFFGLALGEGQAMSPHRQAILKEAMMRSFGATPTVDPASDAPGRAQSAFAAVKGGVVLVDGAGAGEEPPKIDLAQFETPFDRFVRQLGLPTDEKLLQQRYERKKRVKKLVEMIEGAEAAHVAPPQPERPAGILVWHIHSLDSLEIPSTQRTLTSKRSQASKTKLSTAEDHSELSGSRKLPSSYVQVVLNDVAVFRTRTKPLNAQPFVNSGSERWVSDWTRTRIDFVVRDARQRESDAIIGVVGLRLVDVLKDSGRVTDRWSITGGVGYGKIRISLLFRSIDVTVPKPLSGWNIGVLEVGACRVTGLAADDFERRDCSLLFESGSASTETEDADAQVQAPSGDGTGPTVQYSWMLENAIKVPVRTRYPSNLFITLRSDRKLGRHITHAFAMLPLNRIPDNTEITRRIPLFHTQNLQTFEQETLRAMSHMEHHASEGANAALAHPSSAVTSRRAPILEELCEMAEQGVAPQDLVGASIRHVGWLQLTCAFNAGCGPEHRALVSGDSELRMVYESLFALVDAGQRKPPVPLLNRSRRRKLSLELAGGAAAGGTSREAGAKEGSSSQMYPGQLLSLEPGTMRSRDQDSESSHAGAGDSSMASETYYGEDGNEEEDLFGEGSEAAHKRMLRRTQRGPAQLGVVRTMAFLKQSGEDALAKMKARANQSSSSRRRVLGSVEAEGTSHF